MSDIDRLPAGTRELLRWLDGQSGAALAWVNIDMRPQARGPMVRRLVSDGLAELQTEGDGRKRARLMRITPLGRAMCAERTMPDPVLPLLATIERLYREATQGDWSDGTQLHNGQQWDAVFAPHDMVALVNRGPADARCIAFSRNTLAPLASMLRVAVEALETYADERTWRGHINEHGEYVTPVDADHGARARAALATIRRMAEEVPR